MGVYSESGNLKITVNDTTGVGRYAADGSIRVTLVTGNTYTGIYAADGSMNVVDVTGESISTYKGLYHPSGAIRGRLAPFDSYSGFYAPDGSLYLTNFFRPIHLFLSSEQGVWYDPSDLSTLFQDSAGSTPVTAVEQPVGRILDKSGRGNHATQATSGSRPVLSARYNLLTNTENFSAAYWTKSNAAVTANVITAPDGTTTGDLVYPLSTGAARGVYTSVSGTGLRTVSFCFKASGFTWAWIADSSGITGGAWYNLVTGIKGTVKANHTHDMVSLGDGWFRCTLSSSTAGFNYAQIGMSDNDNSMTATVSGTNGIYVWGADVRSSSDGIGLPTYQRVNTSTDYNTSGFPLYLLFDGTDDSLSTSSINFSTTDKMNIFTGIRKLSDAATGMAVELSDNTDSAPNEGSFWITAPHGAGSTYLFASRGTVRQATPAPTGFVSPITNVLTAIGDISGDVARLRINGTQVAETLGDQGTGNYGNHPLYIGLRGGISLPFNGRLYSLVVRGATSSSAQIAATEKWINNKIGAY